MELLQLLITSYIICFHDKILLLFYFLLNVIYFNKIIFHPYDFTSLLFIIIKNMMIFSIFTTKKLLNIYGDKELNNMIYDYYNYFNQLYIEGCKKILSYCILDPLKNMILKSQIAFGETLHDKNIILENDKDIDNFLNKLNN
jgi:hypothetical protein